MRRVARRTRDRREQVPRALTVAGSDGSGGAGIQADLATFAALGVWGCSAITAITVQDTRRVHDVEAISATLVRAQLEALLADLRPGAMKTGMLADRSIVRVVSRAVAAASLERLVVDPVMRATSGAVLLDHPGVLALRDELLPLAYVVTPNLAEAAILAAIEVNDVVSAEEAGRRILRLGPRAVVVKGGHLRGEPIDVLATRGGIRRFTGRRRGLGAHGTGCVFSAALTGLLARGEELETAVGSAKRFLDARLKRALVLGGGRPFADLRS